MRYRQLPPASDRDTLEAVWEAVPADPAVTSDCCARLCERTAVERRSHASEWLVFLSALDCITDDGNGYYRSVDEFDTDALGERFEAAVFGVSEVLAILDAATEPLERTAVLERLDSAHRRGIERAREGYLSRLLAWGVVFDRFVTAGTRYTVENGT